MSSFKKADGIIDSIQKQATGLRTLDGSAIEDFLSIAGYEDPQGGGGGGGGGDIGTKWRVVINSVPMPGNYLNAPQTESSSSPDGTLLAAVPFYNGLLYYTLSFDLTDGLTDCAIEYLVCNPEEPALIDTAIKLAYDASFDVVATGNIEVTHDEYDFICTIAGDGTITITEAPGV